MSAVAFSIALFAFVFAVVARDCRAAYDRRTDALILLKRELARRS